MTDFELFKLHTHAKHLEVIEKDAHDIYMDVFYSPLSYNAATIINNLNTLKSLIKINLYAENLPPYVLNSKIKVHIHGFNKKFLDPDFIYLFRSVFLYKSCSQIEYKRLKRGDNNKNVLWLNQKLYSLGYLAPNKILQCFSEATHKAVLKFQEESGLICDGVVERITFEMLKAKL